MSVTEQEPKVKAANVLLDAALSYLKRGWSVFPLCPADHRGLRLPGENPSKHELACQSPGKTPLTAWKSLQDKAASEAQLRLWWSRWPTANVGMALGPVSGLVGLDLDGEAGGKLLREWSGGNLQETLTFATPNGGMRVLFKLPAGVEIPIRQFRQDGKEAVRILSRGSQTVMPPSKLLAGEYCWVEGCRPDELEPAPCPQWLLDKLLKPDGAQPAKQDRQPVTVSAPAPGAPLDAVDRARLYLRKCDPAISGQGGHAQTFKVACKLVKGFGLDGETALSLLAEEYNPSCQPPWSMKELEHKVSDALKADGEHGYLRDAAQTTAPLASTNWPFATATAGQAVSGSDAPTVAPAVTVAPAPVVIPPIPVKAKPTINAVALQHVRPKSVSWLWHGWIPQAKISVLDGDPDLGKSTVLTDLAARVSTNGRMPDGSQGATGAVILLSAEDDAEDTIVPRLNAAGADLSRIEIIEDVGGHPLLIPEHLFAIEERIKVRQAKLLIIDPLMAFLQGDSCSDQEVRRALYPVKQMAQRTGCAVVHQRHLNKSSGTKAIYRGGGSIGIIAAARAGMLIAPDPDNPRYRVLAQTKRNLAQPQPSLRFILTWIESQGACRVEWVDGECRHSADDLLKPLPTEEEKSEAEHRETKLQLAEKLLTDLLTHSGRVPIRDAKEEAARADIAGRTLERAATRLGLKLSFERGETGRLYYWAHGGVGEVAK
jgi:hypothetical protein